MCHDNQRCAGQVAYMQDVSKAVELRRRLQEHLAYRRTRNAVSEQETFYNAGMIDGMALAVMGIDDLWPDYTHCDNPPAE